MQDHLRVAGKVDFAGWQHPSSLRQLASIMDLSNASLPRSNLHGWSRSMLLHGFSVELKGGTILNGRQRSLQDMRRIPCTVAAGAMLNIGMS
jgi:hypothetical protein